MSAASLPIPYLRDDYGRQADHALRIAEELCRLCYGRALERVDDVTRAQLRELAAQVVREAVNEHALDESGASDAMQAWRDKQERDR